MLVHYNELYFVVWLYELSKTTPLHVNLPNVHLEMREAKKNTGYGNKGLGFGGQQAHGRHGILVVSVGIYLLV